MPETTESERFEADTKDKLKFDDMLAKFKQDIISDADDLSEQRDKANADMRFINVPGGMWEDFLAEDFDNRTKLEVDQTSPLVNKFLGEWSKNRIGVEFKPTDTKTSDDDAELLNGIYRADFRDESGKMALINAVNEATTCGYGAFKLGTKFIDETDPENEEQRIEFRPIYNAYNSIYWDRAAKRDDKRDARRCTVLDTYTKDSFHEVYGDDESPVSAYEPHNRSFNDFSVRTRETIYIATRYEVVRKKETFHIYVNLEDNTKQVYSEEDHKLLEPELKANKFVKKIRERKMIRQTVEKSIFSGEKFLQKPKRIAGRYIPIVPFYAYRSYVDGSERFHGLVRKLMDLQRLLNMQMSQLAENSASSGQDVPIFDPDQMPENIAALWADRNNKPYMLAKSLVDADGNIVQHGPLGYLKPPQLDGSTAALMQIVPQLFQQMTGGAPQDTLDPNASGKAINALISQENLKTQTVMDNYSASIEWGGEVYRSIAGDIYNTPRIMQITGIDGTSSQVQILKEVQDPKTGRIIVANDLSSKNFKAYADVGPAYDSVREQTVEDIKGMLELLSKAGGAGAKYIPILTSIMLESVAGVGLKGLKKIVRQDLILQGVQKPETDEEKQLLAQAEEQANQPDPQQQLVAAAAAQAESEAIKFQSEARNLDSKSMDNVASSRKKLAETRKILAEIGNEQSKTFNTVLNDAFKRNEERAKRLPFEGQ
jgi:hypothetical protein